METKSFIKYMYQKLKYYNIVMGLYISTEAIRKTIEG